MRTAVLLQLTLAFAPLAAIADSDGIYGKISSLSGRNKNRIQIENLESCEGASGLELALCIVERYSGEMQSKQQRNVQMLQELRRNGSAAKKTKSSSKEKGTDQLEKSVPELLDGSIEEATQSANQTGQ
ncbi:unnamed protein product [Heligmosomoides polygyrus]|uniref:Secreted protein n=1 Tax=Heligmosomoides polygyrus TaxID=6339 RepID=A0A183G0T1_HELPZ|nr:unnamed protein product [Heligmosomoides polygyrus]